LQLVIHGDAICKTDIKYIHIGSSLVKLIFFSKMQQMICNQTYGLGENLFE